MWYSIESVNYENIISTTAVRDIAGSTEEGDFRMKMGETYPWSIGFFHMNGIAQFSDLMEL